jgi:phosphopantothenoylcysteine decarboxylase / phosphopantothenate---cysteine ligase
VRPAEGPSAARGRTVVVCVTGGIAAYKVVTVVRDLARVGADVRVVMTPSAQRFVGAQTFAGVSGNPVATELLDDAAQAPHVELARAADLFLVAPATANSLAKMALGIADDLFSATVLTVRCPVLVAPAMHTEMWEHPATRARATELAGRGLHFVGPGSGALMSGDEGPGRLAEPEEIVAAALELLRRRNDLARRTVVVTAGGTQEPIDPVRFIGNRSSGLMGFSVARAALERGAGVTIVAGATSAEPPPGATLVRATTAADMRAAVLELAEGADAIVMAAAVADFRPQRSAERKLKKAAGPPEVELVPTADILAELGAGGTRAERGTVLVGFAAETTADPAELGRVAEEKRASKGADLVVANTVATPDSGFGVRTNRAVMASAEGVSDFGLVTKDEVADALVDQIVKLLDARAAQTGLLQ